MQPAGVDQTPAIAKTVGVEALHVEAAFGAVLEDGYRVVPALDEKVDRLRTELSRVETVEQDRPAAELGVTNFSGEDRFAGGFAPAVPLEEVVADQLDGSSVRNHSSGSLG